MPAWSTLGAKKFAMSTEFESTAASQNGRSGQNDSARLRFWNALQRAPKNLLKDESPQMRIYGESCDA